MADKDKKVEKKNEGKPFNVDEAISKTRVGLLKALNESGLPGSVLRLILENLLLQLSVEKPKK